MVLFLIILVTGCSALIPPTPEGRLVATLRLTAVILMSIIKTFVQNL